MEITIYFTNGTSKLLRPTVYFKPHEYQTIGNNTLSNLHALIADNAKGRKIYKVIAECPRQGRVIDRVYNPLEPKYSFQKSQEERDKLKQLKRNSS